MALESDHWIDWCPRHCDLRWDQGPWPFHRSLADKIAFWTSHPRMSSPWKVETLWPSATNIALRLKHSGGFTSKMRWHAICSSPVSSFHISSVRLWRWNLHSLHPPSVLPCFSGIDRPTDVTAADARSEWSPASLRDGWDVISSTDWDSQGCW